MLNEERMMKVFDAVTEYVAVGESTVVPKGKIREKCEGFTQREIDSALNTLQVNGLMEIKYADGEVYCLGLLPRGVLERDKRERARIEAEKLAARLAAEEEARKAALAAGDTPPPAPEEEEEEEEPATTAFPIDASELFTKKDAKKLTLYYLIPACLGFLLGLIALIYVMVKVK